METQKEFLTIEEARILLGSSRSFVYKLIARGLPHYKVGRRAYLKAHDVRSLFKPTESHQAA